MRVKLLYKWRRIAAGRGQTLRTDPRTAVDMCRTEFQVVIRMRKAKLVAVSMAMVSLEKVLKRRATPCEKSTMPVVLAPGVTEK